MKTILTILLGAVLMAKPDYQTAAPTRFTDDFRINTRILKVPSEFQTIASAVANSSEGDMIIISPGLYVENEIEINKGIVISSEWKLSGDESKIDQTIVDAGDKRLFIIHADEVEISGLRIINGDHTLDINAKVTVSHNHFINNLDGMSFEEGGGGYAGYNTAENDRDDALDVDITVDKENRGSDLLVEHNTFINCHDDGIEIRLFKPRDQNIHYEIRWNRIIGSNNAGIQLISYDVFTGKMFNIHHNTFINCKTGLGCMEGAKTREDLSGASKMDEQVLFYNNTVTGCKMGATGGNNILAFNNLISGNSMGGFKRFGAKSKIYNNLFFMNGRDDLIEIDPDVKKNENLFSKDPLLDENTYYPVENSPCIDAGIIEIETEGSGLFQISSEYINGGAPDIGAVESGLNRQEIHHTQSLQADAGEDRVIESPVPAIVLAGRIRNSGKNTSLHCAWKQEEGPAEAKILDAGKLVTDVILKKEGIYLFSLNCSGGSATANDYVSIRYFNDGDGKEIFLNNQMTNVIEAEDFAYTYGNVEKKKKKYILLNNLETDDNGPQIEYSVGMAEENDYELWLLLKPLASGYNKLNLMFNHKKMGEISTMEKKKFQWVKLPDKISATPGQWQLLIENIQGQVALDKMIFSTDPEFIPF